MRKKKETSKVPETTLQLLWLMIKGFFTSLPKMGIKLLIRSVIMFVVIMLFNIYMLAEVNDGFKLSVPTNAPVFGLLNVAGNQLAFNTLCFLVMFFITSLFTQIKQRGIKKFLMDVLTAPIWAFKCLRTSKSTFYAFFITFGLVALLGLIYQNTYVFITFCFSLFLGFTAKGEGMGSFAMNILYSDFQRVFRYGKEKKTVEKETLGVITLAAIIGLITLIFIPNQNMRLFSIVMPAICLVIVVLVNKRLLSKRSAAQMFVFLTFNLLYFTYTNTIFADDGGKPEAGGTWGNWVGSPGSGEIVRSGVTPGLWGILGGYVAAAGNMFWNGIKIMYGETVEEAVHILYDTGVGMVNQIAETTIYVGIRAAEEIHDNVAALGSALGELSADQELHDAWYDCMLEDLDAIYDTFADPLSQLRDDLTTLYNDQEIRDIFIDIVGTKLDNALNSMEQMGGDAYQALSEVFSEPQAIAEFVGGSLMTAGQLYTNPASFLEPYRPQIENALSSVWQAFSNGVNDPETVYQTIKDMVGADNFGNSWDDNRGVWDRIGQSLWGTFELGGAISSLQDMGARASQMYDNAVGYMDDTNLINRISSQLDEAGNLGAHGSYIQVDYADPDFMPSRTRQALEELAEKYNVKIHVRPGNQASVSWLESGQAIPKPVDLKMKTINSIDEILGAPPNSRGLVGYFEPKMPSAEALSKYDDAMQAAIRKRFDKRMAEIADYGSDMTKYAQQGRYEVIDGLVYDVKTGKRVAGDVDLFSVTRPDGSHLSRAELNRFQNIAENTRRANIEHGAVVDWTPSDPKFNQTARNGMVNATYQGNEGLYTFNPDRSVTTTYVRTGDYIPPRSSSWWTRLWGAGQTVKAAN